MLGDSRRVVSLLSGHRLSMLAVFALLVLAPAARRLCAQDTDQAPLPPRALARIGTDDLRTREPIMELAFSPDGRVIAAAEGTTSSSKVELFDVRTGRQVGRIAPEAEGIGVTCLAFSPDGAKLAWGEQEGHVALWAVADGVLLHRGRIHDQPVNAVAFSPDGRLIASGGGDGVVRVRRVERLAGAFNPAERRDGRIHPGADERDLHDRESQILALAFTPDGTRLVAGATRDEAICIWRLSDGMLLKRITATHGTRGKPVATNPCVVALTPDGRRILSAGRSVVPITRTKVPYGPENMCLSEVRSWDVETGERVLDLFDVEDMGFGNAAFSADGRRIAVADVGVIRILDAATGRTERRIMQTQ
jgi:WD40 repeat protein